MLGANNSGKLAKPVLYILVVFLAVNLLFVLFHWVSDSLVSVELAKSRVESAFEAGALIESAQLQHSLDHGDPVNQIGIDQYTECANGLMLIYRGESGSLSNAIVPEFQMHEGYGVRCRDLNRLARDKADLTKYQAHTKARLWHGAKPFTLVLLPKFELYQIANLIRQLSHIGLALLLGFAFYRSKVAGFALLPVIIFAMLGSGLNIYGGIPNALPYTAALYLAFLVALVQATSTLQNACYVSVFAGSAMAFVYILDGSLILVLSLLLFLLYFTSNELTRLARWKIILTLCSLFVASFFLSFIFKQLISAIALGWEQVWGEFGDFLALRMDSVHDGKVRSHWMAFIDQVGVYNIATSWNTFLRNSIVYTGNAAWVMAIGLATYITLKFRTWAALSDLMVFTLISFVVFFRYAAMMSHSYMHWFIVSRYVFVFFAFGISAFVWMTLLYCKIRANQQGQRTESTGPYSIDPEKNIKV